MSMRGWGYVAILFVGLAVASWASAPAIWFQHDQAHPKMAVAPAAQGAHNAAAAVCAKAAKKGQYSCCINPPCNFCALHMAMCPCGKNLAKGQPVCRECKGGWHVGEGRLPGIKPENVKAMSAKQVMDKMKA